MARRPFSAQFFTGGSSRKGGRRSNYLQQKRRQELRRKAMQAGRPDFFEKFSFLKSEKEPWVLERQKRQLEVREQYNKNRRQMLLKRKAAERELKRELEHEKKEIDEKYRLHELADGDPRRKRAEKMARDKYREIEKIEERKFERTWNVNRGSMFRKLKTDKGKDYRRITKEMKRESRRDRGLPPEMGGL